MIAAWLGVAARFARSVPWQVYAALAIIATAWLWGNHRYSQGVADEAADRDAAIAAAVLDAIEAERAAQAAFEASEAERQADTADLREAVDEAPEGGKTAAVLDALRGK